MIWLKLPFPRASLPELDQACMSLRRSRDLHHGQTTAALLLLGLAEYRRCGALPVSILSAVKD